MLKDQKQKCIDLERNLIAEKISFLVSYPVNLNKVDSQADLALMHKKVKELDEALTLYRYLRFTVPKDFTIGKVDS